MEDRKLRWYDGKQFIVDKNKLRVTMFLLIETKG